MQFDDFDLAMEELNELAIESNLQPVNENSNKNELTEDDRKLAIKILKKQYIGKVPLKYYYDNKDGHHDRIVAQANDYADAGFDEQKFINFMHSEMKRINKTQSDFVFFMTPLDKFIFANPSKNKKKSVPPKKVNKRKTTKENFFIDNSGLTKCEEACMNIPLVKNYMNQGLNLKQAMNLMEANITLHPLLTMDIIPESCFESSDAYDMYLIECFANSLLSLDNDIDTLCESCYYTQESVILVNKKNLQSTMEKIDVIKKVKNTAQKTGKKIGNTTDNVIDSAKKGAHEVKKGAHYANKDYLKPIGKKIVDMVDNLIGDKAVEKEVITGSFALKLRRIFLKLIVVWKSNILTNAILAVFPGGWVALLIKFILWMARLKVYADTTVDVVANGANDQAHDDMAKKKLQELELELKICREKIEDAKNSGNRKAKYDLMRVEHTIEKEIFRITYNQRPTDSDGGRSIMSRSASANSGTFRAAASVASNTLL